MLRGQMCKFLFWPLLGLTSASHLGLDPGYTHIVECAKLAIICACHHPGHVEVRAALETSRAIQAAKVAHTHPVLGDHLGDLPLQDLNCGVP